MANVSPIPDGCNTVNVYLIVKDGQKALDFYAKEKWISGIIYLLTGALFGLGWLYDLCTLNEQVDALNTGTLR